MPADCQKSLDLIRTDQESGAAAAVRHHDRPVVPVQEFHQTRDQVADGTLDRRCRSPCRTPRPGRTARRNIRRAMCCRPRSSRPNCWCRFRCRLLTADPGRVRRIDGNQAAGQQIGSGDVGQRFEAGNRRLHVVQRVGRLRDLVAESLGRQIVSGPERRIAATRVADDLVAVGEREIGSRIVPNGRCRA